MFAGKRSFLTQQGQWSFFDRDIEGEGLDNLSESELRELCDLQSHFLPNPGISSSGTGGRPRDQGGGAGQSERVGAAGGVPRARHPVQRLWRGRARLHAQEARRLAGAVAQQVCWQDVRVLRVDLRDLWLVV